MLSKLGAYRASVDEVRRGLAGIAMSAAVVILGASAANAQSGTPENSNAAGLITIRVGGAEVTPSTPLFVAMRQGFFKEVGLDVTYATIAGGATPMAAALKAGQVDIGLGGTIQYMDYVAKGLVQGKVIGEFYDSAYNVMGAKGITDVRQLEGKVFGISTYKGGDQLYAQALLAHFGIGQDDVTWLPVGAPPSRVAALLAGKVSAIVLNVTATPDNLNGMVIDSADENTVPFISAGIFATQAIITSNKPALQRFLAAIGKGADWARMHPDDAIAACQDGGSDLESCKMTVQAATASKNPYTWSSTSRVNAATIKLMIPQLADLDPQAKTMTVTDFVDTSIAGDGAP